MRNFDEYRASAMRARANTPEWKLAAIRAANAQNRDQRAKARVGSAGTYCTAAVAPLGRGS